MRSQSRVTCPRKFLKQNLRGHLFTLKTIFVALLLGTFLQVSFSANAVEALPISGRLFSNVYAPQSDSANRLNQVSTNVWLQVQPKLADHSSAYITYSLSQFDTTTGSTTATSASTLREGYLSHFSKGWDLRVGQQIVSWGKSDVINPTDFLSAKDYTVLNPDEEVRRKGASMINVAWTPSEGASPFTFNAVWIPILNESRLLFPASRISSSVTGVSTVNKPTPTMNNSESAFKISYAGQEWDASLSYYQGYNHLPIILPVTITSPTAITAQQFFYRQKAVGSDVSMTWGDWLIRGEAAFVTTENPEANDPLTPPSRLDAVVGVERSFLTDFRFQLQTTLRQHPKYNNPKEYTNVNPITQAVYREIGALNSQIHNYQEKDRVGGTLRVSYTNAENGIDTELFLMGNAIGGDYLVRPKFSYLWSDAIRTTLGIDYYGGPDDRPLGALKAYNSVFFEGKYSF